MKAANVEPILNKEANFSLRFNDNMVLDPDTNQNVTFKSLWENSTEEIVVIHFFRRFGWAICKYLASELTEAANAINSNPDTLNKVRLVGIGISLEDYDEFKKGQYFSGQIYIDQGKSIYSELKLKKSGCYNCFGLSCKLFKIAKLARAKNMTNNFEGDKKQNGGEFIVTKSGKLLLSLPQKEATDVIQKEEIEAVILKYSETKSE